MLKRKYGKRPDWKRIVERESAQLFVDTHEFKGHITLLHMLHVSNPLFTTYRNKRICIANNGYMWLQQFPLDKNYSVTTMFDENGEIIQWLSS